MACIEMTPYQLALLSANTAFCDRDARILNLTLKKKWFDMIESGEKKEEYRELKPYWVTRLTNGIKTYPSIHSIDGKGYEVDYKEFDFVLFRNGYAKDAPCILVECKGIDMGKGKSEWGAIKESFIIKLGKLI